MARCIAWIFAFNCTFSAFWCLTLDPYPTVNVTRYNSQSFKCSVAPKWNLVVYNYDGVAIAFFGVENGTCKDFQDHTKGLYTTDCNDSIQTFYLTINNVTSDYNEQTIECSTSPSSKKMSLIYVQYQPTTSPTITQTPVGPIIEGNKVTLTCTIQGGNPVATITWSCEGDTQITSTGSSSTEDAISSVELVTSKNKNGQICTCTGRHILWTNDKAQQHTIAVYYSPTISIMSMDPLEVVENETLKLVCQVLDANPTVTSFSWYKGSSTTPIGMESNFSISKVSKKNSGEYRCDGSNGIGQNGTDTVYVNVLYSPTVSIMHMRPLDVVENKTLQLACQVLDANPTVISFSWYKGISRTPIGMESNFSISKVIRTDSGEYRCEGSNGIGQNGTDTVYVNVLYNPAITLLSVINGSEIVENDTAIVQCIVESNPLSKIEWTFENKTLNEDNHGVLQSNYTILGAKCVDTGFYMCTATNIINMESYSDKNVVHLSVKCSPRTDNMFELPDNQVGLGLGQHMKIQIHIIAYPPPVVEWRFRSADNSTTETLSSNCNQTNMFKHTVCFEKDNVTEDDFGQYSIFVHNGLGNNFSYFFNVDPQGPPDMSSNVNTSCKVLSTDILWTTGFHGGKQQQFYVIVLDVKTRIAKIYNTHQFGNEKKEDKSYNIALQPGLYTFRIFGNNSFGNATSGGSTCQINDQTSESNSVIAVAAGTGSAAAALIIGVVIVIVVLRKRMANAKGNENSGKERVNMTPMDGDEVVEGLQENDCYVSAGPHFRPKDTGAANYEFVERKGQSNAKDVKQDSQETALYSIVHKKSSAKGKTTRGEKTNDGPDQNEDVYENFTNQGSSDNQKQNVNKDGLQYSQLVFNPLPNGSKFIIHGIEDKTIYAEVDTTQKIDALPESDDEDKGNET